MKNSIINLNVRHIVEDIIDKITLDKKLYNPENVIKDAVKSTVIINVNNKKQYVCYMVDGTVKVFDENKTELFKLLDTDGGRVSLVTLKNKLYIFTPKNNYIYDINDLKKVPIVKKVGRYPIADACTNGKVIYGIDKIDNRELMQEDWSVRGLDTIGLINEFDEDLNVISKYKNPCSTKIHTETAVLTCNKDTFITVPVWPTMERYGFLSYIISSKIGFRASRSNTYHVRDCSYNYDDNVFYVAMDDILWIINDQNSASYLYFKKGFIESVLYDRESKKLIIVLGYSKNDSTESVILELSPEDLKEKAKLVVNPEKTYNLEEDFKIK